MALQRVERERLLISSDGVQDRRRSWWNSSDADSQWDPNQERIRRDGGSGELQERMARASIRSSEQDIRTTFEELRA